MDVVLVQTVTVNLFTNSNSASRPLPQFLKSISDDLELRERTPTPTTEVRGIESGARLALRNSRATRGGKILRDRHVEGNPKKSESSNLNLYSITNPITKQERFAGLQDNLLFMVDRKSLMPHLKTHIRGSRKAHPLWKSRARTRLSRLIFAWRINYSTSTPSLVPAQGQTRAYTPHSRDSGVIAAQVPSLATWAKRTQVYDWLQSYQSLDPRNSFTTA